MSDPAEVGEQERLAVGAPVRDARTVFLSRPVLAAALAFALSFVPEVVPGLATARVWSRPPAPQAPAETLRDASGRSTVGEAELSTETRGRGDGPPAAAPAVARGPIPAAQPVDPEPLLDKPPKVPIVDPTGKALDGLFASLDRTRSAQPGAITRIVHFGDSIVASDYVSGTLRRRFQERFGDAGHGFALIANAWPAYSHNDIERYATVGWKVSRVTGPLVEDGFYGMGFVSFRAERHALARFSTTEGKFGNRVSRFSVSYLEVPGGGTFELTVDGTQKHLVDTAGPTKRSRWYVLDVPDGPHSFEILTKSGLSRLFGVVLERRTPGVVLDAIGIQGARIRFLDKQDDAHWAEQLASREPALLIYQFGANESADGFLYSMEDYHRTMKEVLEQAQRAVPKASCLVIGAMDRAAKRGDELISIRVLPHLIAQQKRVATEVGCAFFDTFEAMGGTGSMPNWVKRGLGQADLTHPTGVGAELIGTWIFRALMQRYGEYVRAAAPAAPSPSNSSPNREPSTR
ncbi:MAG TPA: GDSL-type esterase/lipase family protein [Polyangiaceae bacterium]